MSFLPFETVMSEYYVGMSKITESYCTKVWVATEAGMIKSLQHDNISVMDYLGICKTANMTRDYIRKL